MNTYTWQFPALEVYKQQGNETNVVYNVHWRYIATTGSYVTDAYGMIGLDPYNSGSPFIPFNQLTEEIVTDWVVDEMGQDKLNELQQILDDKISGMISPPTELLPPPWMN